jgi:glycosyltransferase involved in cell wall biosynthesis
MNLLFLTYQGGIAGSTNSISYLAQGLANKGHNVFIGCRKESLLYSMLENSPVHLLPMQFKGKLDRDNMRQIRDAVKEHDIQLINAQSSKDRYTSIFARWLYKLPVKVVHTRRNYPKSMGGWFQNSLYTKGTDKIVVVSEEMKKAFIKMGIPENHLKVIYNGLPEERLQLLDPRKTEQLRYQLKINPSHKIIGFVGRRKNQQQLISALPHLTEKLTVIFVGIEEDYLQEALSNYKPKQRIICTGILPAEEAFQYYGLFDVKVLASLEGFGLVLIEAMGMGVPVIGTNAMGIKNVIEDGKSGLLFEDGNPRDLAEKIKLVLENDKLRAQLIRNGKERALHTFSMENTVQAYEQFFSDLI